MRPCPLCQSDKQQFLIYETPAKQDIIACNECGMVFADGLPPVDYAKDSIYTCPETYSAQKEHYRLIVSTILRAGIPVIASVLDVGCALGGLMKEFMEVGIKGVRGISLSCGEVEHCVSMGLDAIVCDVEESFCGTYNLVTLSHVLEHVSDVRGFLKNLVRWSSGYIYIEVPNALKYTEQLKSVCQGFNSEHINHFDLSHLMRACLDAGMSIENCGSHDIHVDTLEPYPVIWVLAKVGTPLQDSVQRYCSILSPRIDAVLSELRTKLAASMRQGRRVCAIWGCGETARMLLETEVFDGVFAWAATDTNPVYHGRKMFGVIVVSPEDFHPPADVPILITSQTRAAEIEKTIRALGLTNSIINLVGA